MRKIGIFGGTFNPPHLGHKKIAEMFSSQFELEEVLIIPTFIPPHKEAKDLVCGEDRLEMCRLTFIDPQFTVSDIELRRGGLSYTYLTLEELHQIYPDTEFYFLVGDDMLFYLDNWAEPHRVLKNCIMVSSIRSDEASVEQLKAFAAEHYPEELAAGRFEFFKMQPIEVSSTEIRGKIKSGEDVSGLVSEETNKYILEKGLYQ